LTEIGILLGLVGEKFGVDVGNWAKNQLKVWQQTNVILTNTTLRDNNITKEFLKSTKRADE